MRSAAESCCEDWSREAGPWAPLAYVVAKAATTIVAPLCGIPLKAASGALFGFVGGIGYSALGDVIGGCVCFWATRYAGRSVVVLFAGTDGMARVDEFARYSGGWRAVLFGRLVLSPVYNLVSYAAGLTKLPFWQYLAVTALGGIVHTSFLVSLGASAVLDWKMRLAAYAGIAVLAALALLGGRRLRRILDRGCEPKRRTLNRWKISSTGRPRQGAAKRKNGSEPISR